MTKTPTVLRRFKPNELLFKEGDTSNSMYLVKKGTVAIRKSKFGGYVEIARIYSNEVLGELSFFDRKPRSASAVAMTEVEVMEISFEGLDKIYADVPDYMKSIIASLAERLRRANDTIRRLQKNRVVEKQSQSAADASAADELSEVDAILSAGEIPSDIPADRAADEPKED